MSTEVDTVQCAPEEVKTGEYCPQCGTLIAAKERYCPKCHLCVDC